MKRFFESNLFYGIVAVGMAVFLLLYVASSENPVTDKTFSNVNVTVNGLAEGYLLEANPRPVEIRVSGYRSNVNLTFARDVKAYVDLSSAQPGTAIYPVNCTIPSGLSLAYVQPDYVELTIDVFEARELPVVAETVNDVQQGFSSREPEIKPSVITVSGPRKALDQIAGARVSLDLSGRTRDFSGELPVVLVDKANQVFEDRRVDLSDEEVSVYVGISENLSSKSVSVRTPMSGNMDNRYIMTGMDVQPATVKITGSYATVSAIEYVNTEAIDLSSLTETFHGFIPLLVPPGVTVLEGDTVEITIRVEKNLVRRTVEGVPLEVLNAPEDMDLQVYPAAVSVTLAAYPDLFEPAEDGSGFADDVRAYIDLAGGDEGQEEEQGDGQGDRQGDGQEGAEYTIFVEVPEDFLVIQVIPETARLGGAQPGDDTDE
ncbi:MAG: CdaR family protein [Clostridiales bacterium]|nr:CdaR family protein [Clostridiales bacterium]